MLFWLQLVQIIINTTHLEQACRYLEDFITNITNVSPETVHTTRLYGLSTFKVKTQPRVLRWVSSAFIFIRGFAASGLASAANILASISAGII